jgi:WXXGXW repeat (2 copies)
MKPFVLIISFLIINSICKAQNTVADTHPAATIFAIDYQSGQEVLARSDAAILFKDAFIDLVNNTNTAKLSSIRIAPGRRSTVITQSDPQTNGNAYQLSLQSTFLRQTATIYTFLYNVDQNTLYFYNQSVQNWVPELVQGNNVVNLNNCLAYGKFNIQDSQPVANIPADNPQQATDNNTPVDTAVSVRTAPPALPEYEQPECPAEGYLWQPGYWAYSLNANDYYWVPGVWVAPPATGLLWTPAFWGYEGSLYIFHTGYWGATVGFYGGITYGYGYAGEGFVGGEWRNGGFRYNTAVVRVNTMVIHNTYVNDRVVYRGAISRSSFNGRGGVMARPNAREMEAMHQPHIRSTDEQIRNQRVARTDKTQFAAANHGQPAAFARERAPAANSGGNTGNQRGGGAPGTFGNQRATGATGNPGNQRVGGAPGNPGNQRIGGSPGNPGNQRVGGVGGAPVNPENQRVGGAPGNPGNQRIGGSPGSPGNPRVGGVGGAPANPENQRVGGAPGNAGNPGNQRAGGTPGSPGAPGVGVNPGNPGPPRAAGTQGAANPALPNNKVGVQTQKFKAPPAKAQTKTSKSQKKP